MDASSPKNKRASRAKVRRREVREFWRESCAARAALVPKPERVLRSKEDLVALREQVSVALWETVVATFADIQGNAGGKKLGGDGAVPLMTKPPMLSVRLRALRRMSKLYGVDCQVRAAADAVPVNCATPEEIAESVREWMREREGRIF